MKRTIKATYSTSVFKPNLNAWRQETVTAKLEQISPKKFKVIYVYGVSNPGSKRQYFNVNGIEQREMEKVKLLSSLYNIEEMEEKNND